MTKFVLEILDGDRAGTVVPLDQTQVKIGRRPDNDVVIPDEKCSGHHATVDFEEGRHVLRDLQSTNGTMIDGHRVQEVTLSPGDVVQLGRIRVCFRREGESAGLDDLRVDRVDAARLSSTKKRSSTAALLALIVVAGGVGAWLVWGRGMGEQTGVQQNVRAPLQVAGNLLPEAAATVEQDGGWTLAAVPDSAPWEVEVSRARAHTGTSALIAELDANGDEPLEPHFALARLSEPLTIVSGTALEAVAHVRTEGDARAALRVTFSSSVDDRSVTAGAQPVTAPDGFERVTLTVRAPAGLDRAHVELLALLPDADAAVLADDVALVRVAEADALEGQTRNGRALIGAGESFRIDGTTESTLVGVTPLVEDPVLSRLAAANELTPSDAGLELTIEPIDDIGFRVRYVGADASGLRVWFPLEAAAVRTRGPDGDESFVERSPDFDADGVAVVLLGSAEGRCMLQFDDPAAVRGAVRDGRYALDLPGRMTFDLVTVFGDEVQRAIQLERTARHERDAGRPAEALRAVRELVTHVPHDPQRVRSALTIRTELLAEQEERIRELERDSVSASFFDARIGYERVIAGIDALIARFGEENVQRLEDLRALRERMTEGVAELDRRSGAAHAEQLAGLAEAFESAGREELAGLLRGYVERHYSGIADASDNGERDK